MQMIIQLFKAGDKESKVLKDVIFLMTKQAQCQEMTDNPLRLQWRGSMGVCVYVYVCVMRSEIGLPLSEHQLEEPCDPLTPGEPLPQNVHNHGNLLLPKVTRGSQSISRPT